MAAKAEREHSVPSSLAEYKRLLNETGDWDSGLWLAEMLARSHDVHHAWLAVTLGRLRDMKRDSLDDSRKKILTDAAERYGIDSTVPFMGLMMKIAAE